jgi:DNA repair protein RecN (Recombination protein N)
VLELKIELRPNFENYAVIDNVVIEFAAGLNLLTGETGAGKSILIDALGLLLGEKASSDVIRTGAERAVVAAVFESDGAAARSIEGILETNGLDAENGSLILRREIAAGGKGRVFINNQPATVAVLKQIAPHLAVIHAQNESIVNFDAAARQELLDAYAGVELKEVSGGVRTLEADSRAHRGTRTGRAGSHAAAGPVEFPVPRNRRGASAGRRR